MISVISLMALEMVKLKKSVGKCKRTHPFHYVLLMIDFFDDCCYSITLVHVHTNVLQYKQSRTRTDE